VISNSWGFRVRDNSLTSLKNRNENQYREFVDIQNQIYKASELNISVVFAAGNGFEMFPANIPGIISVGGVYLDENYSLEASNYCSSYESSYYPGRKSPDFCGICGSRYQDGAYQLGHIMLPVSEKAKRNGKNVPLKDQIPGWGLFSGTSSCAPQVAGVIALMKQINYNLTASEIQDILSESCIDITKGVSAMGDSTNAGFDPATGHGLVDALAACSKAQECLLDV